MIAVATAPQEACQFVADAIGQLHAHEPGIEFDIAIDIRSELQDMSELARSHIYVAVGRSSAATADIGRSGIVDLDSGPRLLDRIGDNNIDQNTVRITYPKPVVLESSRSDRERHTGILEVGGDLFDFTGPRAPCHPGNFLFLAWDKTQLVLRTPGTAVHRLLAFHAPFKTHRFIELAPHLHIGNAQRNILQRTYHDVLPSSSTFADEKTFARCDVHTIQLMAVSGLSEKLGLTRFRHCRIKLLCGHAPDIDRRQGTVIKLVTILPEIKFRIRQAHSKTGRPAWTTPVLL